MISFRVLAATSSSVFTENDDTHLMRYIAAERAEVDASADTLQVYEALVSKGCKDLSFRWVLCHDARAWMERCQSMRKASFEVTVEDRDRQENLDSHSP